MQAIMLAAGKGSRLGKLTKNNTKCMLEVNGVSLLERAINALLKADINKLIMVVGYKMDNLKEYIKEKGLDKKIQIEYIDNYDYNTTNNIYSLYMAKDYFDKDDTILLESDLIYEEDVIKNLVDCKDKNAALVAKYEQWMDGTVVTLDNKRNITQFIEKSNFNFNDIDKYYKTVNIYKFSKEYMMNYYLPFLESYIKAYGKNDYYELVLKVIAGLPKSGLKGIEIKEKVWYEIDDCQDYDISTLLFSTDEDKLKLYQKRFGGYWRFENLKDYCYLVNPYFPTDSMINKIKINFKNLLTNYPSTMSIQSNCISRFFEVDEKNLLVGNGAAELINGLRYVLNGKIAVPTPTFNEYIRCLPNCDLVRIDLREDNYKITKERLLSYIDEVNGIVIVNPDNPCGNFLTKEDILEVIEEYNKKEKYVIFDESFIDFADPEIRYTLLCDEIINQYKYLIIIKSISKSYGVPGLRLGVLASGNLEILKVIKDNMPVWNINSFAEYFLQIFIPYKKDYLKSCDKIAEVRKQFISDLEKIDYLKVYNSQANYLMIEMKKGSSSKLALYLLKNYNIFIKDLSTKDSFKNKNFIRLAIKNKEDNDILIEALKSFDVNMK